jgi:hypothetical protein
MKTYTLGRRQFYALQAMGNDAASGVETIRKHLIAFHGFLPGHPIRVIAGRHSVTFHQETDAPQQEAY